MSLHVYYSRCPSIFFLGEGGGVYMRYYFFATFMQRIKSYQTRKESKSMARATTVTQGGYKKKEVYTELERLLTEKNIECAYSMAAELFSTSGEHDNVLAFFLDHYARYRCNSCLAILQSVDNCVSRLLARMEAMKKVVKQSQKSQQPKRSCMLQPWMDSECRQELCGLVVRIACIDVKTMNISADAALISESSDGKYHTDKSRMVMSAFSETSNVDPDLIPVLTKLVINVCERPSDTKAHVQRVMSTVMCVMRVHPELHHKDSDMHMWSELADVRPSMRKSVAWVLWKLAVHIADAMHSKSLKAYVLCSLRLFKRVLLKVHMDARQNMLLYAYACLARGGVRRTDASSSNVDLLVQQACQYADVVFADVLNSAMHVPEYAVEHEQLQRKEDHKMMVQQDKMKVLRCVTYRDPVARLSVETDISKPVNVTEVKEIIVNHQSAM